MVQNRRWEVRGLLLGVVALLLGVNLLVAEHYALNPLSFDRILVRAALSDVFSMAYHGDMEYVRRTCKGYVCGDPASEEPVKRWQQFTEQHPLVSSVRYNAATALPEDVPFVYQSAGQPYLVNLASKYRLKQLIADSANEYDAMLRVCNWLGTRWDHGSDDVPGGTQPVTPDMVIEGGGRGGKYWCEIAAKVTVEVASALGWPARLVTASKDGYTWDHAVTELWSNHFNKWFVVDTDFNVLYESDGVPLSAFELCHKGTELQRQGRLQVRRFAPAKPSLRLIDLVPFYRYVHIDLRNDWFTRRLRRGSPAGGDISTWWTARKDLGPILTAKIRIDERAKFDWKMNQVEILPLDFQSDERGPKQLSIALRAYSPFLNYFEIFSNGKRYTSRDGRLAIEVVDGANVVGARTVDKEGRRGPLYQVSFLINQSQSR